ncbi:MAG TPA: TetR/AcrR family transcriptional regulator, partial [Acidimicrobiia bacterium]
ARTGFHQTTMADIAAEAGVSDTLAYRYFSSKDELIEAAIRRHDDVAVDALAISSDGVEDFRALVDLLIGTNVRRFEHPEEMRATMGMYFQVWAEALHDDDAREQVVDRWRHHFDIAEGMVRRAQAAEQISSRLDPRAVAWVMLATHYGSNLLAVLDPEVDLEKSKEVMVAMIFGEFLEQTGGEASQSSHPDRKKG